MLPPSDDQAAVDELRLVHWNIHSWRDRSGDQSNVDAVADLLRETNPHAVSLVEVDESWGAPSQLAEVAARVGYSWIFTPAFEYGGEAPQGGFGNAVLAKLPILAVQQWQLLWPPSLYDGTEPSEARSVVFARLRISSDESLWVGSTHLPRGDAEARVSALGRVNTALRGLSGQWILCGDFNIPASGWLDRYPTWTVSPDPARPTYPADEPSECIDYCVASAALSVEAEVLTTTGSDHRPLLLRCRMARR